MAPRAKPPKKRRSKRDRMQAELDAAVAETTETLACSQQLARALAERCDDEIDGLLGDTPFDQIAAELWAKHAEASSLFDALAAFLEENHRHAGALLEISERLHALAADETAHVHLEADGLAEHVRGRLMATAARIAMESWSDEPEAAEAP